MEQFIIENFPLYVTIKQLSECLYVSTTTIKRLIYSGQLTAHKKKGIWLIEREEIIRFLENHLYYNLDD